MSRRKNKDPMNQKGNFNYGNQRKKTGFFSKIASAATAALSGAASAFRDKPEPKPERTKTEFDFARIAKARRKRERKAARREAEAKGQLRDFHCSDELWKKYRSGY